MNVVQENAVMMIMEIKCLIHWVWSINLGLDEIMFGIASKPKPVKVETKQKKAKKKSIFGMMDEENKDCILRKQVLFGDEVEDLDDDDFVKKKENERREPRDAEMELEKVMLEETKEKEKIVQEFKEQKEVKDTKDKKQKKCKKNFDPSFDGISYKSIIDNQHVEGYFTDLPTKMAKYEDIPEDLKDQVTDSGELSLVWNTIVCLLLLTIYCKDTEENWTMLAKKARNYLKKHNISNFKQYQHIFTS
jgi:hypothetical protein